MHLLSGLAKRSKKSETIVISGPSTYLEYPQKPIVYPSEPNILKTPTEIVYVDYDPAILPPKPAEEGWTRFVCVSDTHTHAFPVPDGDVLLHGGDLTNTGLESEYEQTVDWLAGLPHEVKIVIAGNHDLSLHDEWYETHWHIYHTRRGKQRHGKALETLKGKKAKKAGIVYLDDEKYEFKLTGSDRTWSVYGTPWSPEFGIWAFGSSPENAAEIYGKIPKTDILLTHGPPRGIFDRTRLGTDVGSFTLRYRLPELRPRLHLFGHIHEARGAAIHTWDNTKEPPSIQNAHQILLGDVRPNASTSTLGTAPGSTKEGDTQKNEELEEPPRSTFINAAAWPMGPAAYYKGTKVGFGEYGFQPVVVDMKD